MTQHQHHHHQPIFSMDMDMDIDIKLPKKVHFYEIVEVKYTYSKEIYDRSSINSAVVLKHQRKLNNLEWRKIFIELNQFKIYEMEIHPESKNYTAISKIPSLF